MRYLWTIFWLKKRVKDPQGQESQDNKRKDAWRLNDWKLLSSLTHYHFRAAQPCQTCRLEDVSGPCRGFFCIPMIRCSIVLSANHSLKNLPNIWVESLWPVPHRPLTSEDSRQVSPFVKNINMNILYCWSVQLILKYFSIFFSLDNLLFIEQITSLKTRFT